MTTAAHSSRTSHPLGRRVGALLATTAVIVGAIVSSPAPSIAAPQATKGLAYPTTIVRGTPADSLMVGSSARLERSLGGAGTDVMLTGNTTGMMVGKHPAGGEYLPYMVDTLHGGAHNDILIGATGSILDCGAGPNDVVIYNEMSWRNELAGYGVMAGSAINCEFKINLEALYADLNGPVLTQGSATGGVHVRDSDNRDTIVGTKRADVIMTSKGGSEVANGYERVTAGAGNDTIILMGSKTQVSCGAGNDTVISRNGAHKVTFSNGVVGSGIYSDCERVIDLSHDMSTATSLRG